MSDTKLKSTRFDSIRDALSAYLPNKGGPLEVVAKLLVLWILPSRKLERRIWPIALGLGYIGLVSTLGGLRPDHIILGMLSLLDAYNEKTRLFIRHFLPFIVVGAIYDFMRYFYWSGIEGRVRVAEPYFRDLKWFGISTASGSKITPNEYFEIHHWAIVDLFCGFAYLMYIAQYLSMAFYLFFRKHHQLLRFFGVCFFIDNLMGFITYFIYPAAPPWYVTQYGLGPAQMKIAPNAAGAQRFDLLLGTHLIDDLYSRGVDIYGAYPSLHVTYPLLVAWATFQVADLKWARIPAIGFYFLMCFSAVYLQHHYIVDVLLGTAYALGTLAIVSWAQARKLLLVNN